MTMPRASAAAAQLRRRARLAKRIARWAVSVGKDIFFRPAREIEGGRHEISTIELPCVLSIQTGINEPRYVGVRSLRGVAGVEIPCLGPADLGLDAAALAPRVKRAGYFMPELGAGAEMLEGDQDEIIAKLLEMLKAKGGLK